MLPWTITPGRSDTSAIHRASTSFSTSILKVMTVPRVGPFNLAHPALRVQHYDVRSNDPSFDISRDDTYLGITFPVLRSAQRAEALIVCQAPRSSEMSAPDPLRSRRCPTQQRRRGRLQLEWRARIILRLVGTPSSCLIESRAQASSKLFGGADAPVVEKKDAGLLVNHIGEFHGRSPYTSVM